MMKHRMRYILFLLAVGMFGACTNEDREVVQPGQTVTRELAISVANMQASDGAPVTRSAQSADEKKINTLYVVQFDGTASTSKVAAAGAITVDAANKGNFAFAAPAAAGACRTYVVANFTPTVTVGTTTLAAFEKMGADYPFKWGEGSVSNLPALPMSGYVDLDLQATTTIPSVKLKLMVAKLVVSYDVSSAFAETAQLSLLNIPSSTSFGVPTTYDVAQYPTGSTIIANRDETVLGTATAKTYVCYVPENLAGRVSTIQAWTSRSLVKAPANALYFLMYGPTADGQLAKIYSYIGDTRTPDDFNIRRNTVYTMTATASNLDESDERIVVTPDYYDLNVDGKSANCYIVTGNENGETHTIYGLDCTKRGNGYESTTDANVSGISYSTLPDLTTATEARVIWQTGGATSVVKLVKLYPKARKVLFELGTATEGNAVIGIFASSDAAAPCLWSWHIWRLPTAPSTVTGSKTSATTGSSVSVKMMDRNLGAYNNTAGNVGSIGLLYQWGRKDPFPGPGGFSTAEPTNIYGSWNNGGSTGSWPGTYSIKTSFTSATIGTEAWAVKYPTAFIISTSANGEYDWYWGSTRNDHLWGTPWEAGGTGSYNKNQGTKSIYDPCPVGYRVPPQDTWSKQTVKGSFSNNGIILGSFHSSLWFPAAGFRNAAEAGMLVNSPSYGIYWSSSPFASGDVYGGFLTFNSEGVFPYGYDGRGLGCSVRCVSDQP